MRMGDDAKVVGGCLDDGGWVGVGDLTKRTKERDGSSNDRQREGDEMHASHAY